MKWILFTGTWRLTNSEVEEDVRVAAREVRSRGDGIITGGATGGVYFAMDEAMKLYILMHHDSRSLSQLYLKAIFMTTIPTGAWSLSQLSL